MRLDARILLVAALAAVAVALAGCNDYATDGCSPLDALPVPDFWAGPGVTDVTFLAFGDSQVFGAEDGGGKNALHVQALNAADTLDWSGVGVEQPVSRIRGVLMAGDITQIGRDWRGLEKNEYGIFVQSYGLCGNRTLRFPLYEGYGNHDFRDDGGVLYGVDHPVADSVGIRNPFRAGLSNQAPGNQGHYSWDWDGVHFVNVNLAPSDVVPNLDHPGKRDPRMALSYLSGDLARVGTETPVVLMMHYGPGSPTFEWTAGQIVDFAAAIEPYDVIAIVHGHAHNTSTYTWEGIPVFNVGSPYYEVPNPTGDGRGHFAVLRITDEHIYAIDVSWDPNDPTSLTAPALWSRVVDRAE